MTKKIQKIKNYGRMTFDGNTHYDSLYNDEITYNVHPDVLIRANSFQAGDLIETAEGHIGLIIGEAEYDRQGFLKYEVSIGGKKFLYTSIEMKKMENK